MIPSYMKHNFNKGSHYIWSYLRTSTSRIIQRFKRMRRIGHAKSDWVGGRAWSSPVVPLAPPVMRHGV
jgi:hypothetical protein